MLLHPRKCQADIQEGLVLNVPMTCPGISPKAVDPLCQVLPKEEVLTQTLHISQERFVDTQHHIIVIGGIWAP